MNCPKCNAWSLVLETRKRPAGTYRRYECANLHRFSTVDGLVTRIDNGALKAGRQFQRKEQRQCAVTSKYVCPSARHKKT